MGVLRLGWQWELGAGFEALVARGITQIEERAPTISTTKRDKFYL
jgi:hypothetical protein